MARVDEDSGPTSSGGINYAEVLALSIIAEVSRKLEERLHSRADRDQLLRALDVAIAISNDSEARRLVRYIREFYG